MGLRASCSGMIAGKWHRFLFGSLLVSLRDRLLVLVVLAVLPALGLIVYSAIEQRRSAIEDAQRQARNLAAVVAGEQQRVFQQTHGLLATLSVNPRVAGEESQQRCSARLADIKAIYKHYANIGVVRRDGMVSCSALPWDPSVNLADRDYFLRAVNGREFAVGNYQIGRITKIATINLAYPIIDDGHNVAGVVFAAVDLRWLNDTISRARLPSGSSIKILDSESNVLAAYPDASLVGTSAPGPFAEFIRNPEPLNEELILIQGENDVLYSFFPLLRSSSGMAYISIGIERATLYREAHRSFYVNTLMLGILTLIMLGAARAGSRVFVLRHVDALGAAARRLADGDLGARSGMGDDPSELGQLSRTFDLMADNLETRNRELARTTRALRALSAGNRALIRASQTDGLAQDNCRILVGVGGYVAAIVSYRGDTDVTGDLKIEWAVRSRDFKADLGALWAGSAAMQALCEEAKAASGTRIVHHLPDLQPPDAFTQTLSGLGAVCVIVFPLHADDCVVGCVTICSSEPSAFEGEELSLLGEMADDLGFGISTIHARGRHQQAQEMIRHLAYHDTLTGLPNRICLLEDLRQAILDAEAAGIQLALLSVGVGRLGEINNALGHQHGDFVLRETAQRIRRECGGSALVARVADQSFAILLVGADAGQAPQIAKRVLDRLDAPYESGESILSAHSSIGIAVFPEHGRDAELLLRRANAARSRAREEHVGVLVHSGEPEAENARRLELVSRLRSAVNENQLVLFCQPKLDIRSRNPCGMEMLVRWQMPSGEWVSPSEFIPIAEQSGLIGPLTYWILDRAAHHVAVDLKGDLEWPAAINLSARNIEDPQLLGRLRQACTTWGIPPERLELEITEGALLQDTSRSIVVFNQLRAEGFQLHIDDFGTGYSGLGYLKQLPVSAVKIDQSFVTDMLTNQNSAVIVRSTIDLAHNLGLKVIAEGVEDEQTLQSLADLECDIAQGYCIAKPMRVSELRDWLGKHQ